MVDGTVCVECGVIEVKKTTTMDAVNELEEYWLGGSVNTLKIKNRNN